MNSLEFTVKLLRDPLNVQRRLHALYHARNLDVSLRIQFAHGHKEAAHLAQVEVRVLPAVVMVGAVIQLIVFPLHPIPDTVRPRLVHKNEQVFMVIGRNFLLHRRPCFAVGNLAVGRSHLKHHHARKFGNGMTGEFGIFHCQLYRL